MENRTGDGELPGLYLHLEHFAFGVAGGYGERGSNRLRNDINIPASDTDICRFHLLHAGSGRGEKGLCIYLWSTEEKN